MHTPPCLSWFLLIPMKSIVASNTRRLLGSGDLARRAISRRVLAPATVLSTSPLQVHGRNISFSPVLQRQTGAHEPTQPHIPKIPKAPRISKTSQEYDSELEPVTSSPTATAPATPSVGGFAGNPFSTGSSAFDALLTTVVGLGMRECVCFVMYRPPFETLLLHATSRVESAEI